MGVPAFYRWLSEKYPKIVVDMLEDRTVRVEGTEIPLDLTKENPNGIEVCMVKARGAPWHLLPTDKEWVDFCTCCVAWCVVLCPRGREGRVPEVGVRCLLPLSGGFVSDLVPACRNTPLLTHHGLRRAHGCSTLS